MSSSDPRLREAIAQLPDALAGHLQVSLAALALGLLISFPLALLLRNRPWPRAMLLGFAGVVQTIPGLALLALFYPLLLALAAVTLRWFGFGFSAFGFLPAMLALALYSMLPVLRNTIVGLDGVAGELREAALATGMTPSQSLWRIELPLAWPVVIAGVRTAAVWVIGTATLATPIGQPSLGNLIFAGLQTQNWVLVLTGCIAAALLAVLVDRLLGLLESVWPRRWALRRAIGIGGLMCLVAAALLPLKASSASIVVGAKTFGEQYVLAALIADRLRAHGLAASVRQGLGSNVIFAALAAGEIDVYVDYSGTLWTSVLQKNASPPREAMLEALRRDLDARGVTLLGALGFENAYTLLMPRKRAGDMNLRSIAYLAAPAPALAIGGDYEFFSRPEWARLREAYGLRFRAERIMQPDLLYAAAASGEVDVIAGYSSDGLIAMNDLVALADPSGAIPPYDAVLLLSPRRRNDAALKAALIDLVGRIDLDVMRGANLRVASSETADAAARWLAQRIARPARPSAE